MDEGQVISLVNEECFANAPILDAQQATEALEKRIEAMYWIWQD